MASPAVSPKTRAVLCRHCGKPIRVPALVMKKENDFLTRADSGDMQFHLVSRVFNVRCRACERESVYAIDQIVDCTFPSQPTGSDRNSAAL